MKNTGIGLHQTQKLVISPQLQHAIKLLQLSSLELTEKIETELAENPFLEENEEFKEQESDKGTIEGELLSSDSDKSFLEMNINNKEISIENQSEDNFFEDSSDSGFMKKSTLKSDENSKQQFLENAFAVETTIYEHLISQLRLLDISDQEFYVGEIIISSLDENGYLFIPVEDIAASCKCPVEDVTYTLSLIHSLDPPGIGGRNLRETLLIQINQLENKNALAEKMVENDLQLLEKARFKQIASNYQVAIEEVKKAARFISQLEPIPARQFDSEKIRYVIPDIFVKKVEDGYSVSINDNYIPDLTINKTYKEILQKEKVSEQAQDFFNKKYSEAKLLLFSLEKRKSTIARVVEQIIDHQKEFFEKGPQYLNPLILRDIAEKIGMHESTVSRVTTNKYMETPWGIFSLKYFFSSGIRKNTGEMKSSRSIKEIIKEIIENEQSDKALSDDKIVKILSNRGIKIARRTVAKYRKSLKILSSFQRKEKLQSQ